MSFIGSINALLPDVSLQSTEALLVVGLAIFTLALLCLSRPGGPGPLFTLPWIGDTIWMMRDPAAHLLKRYLKYGGVYKTQIAGTAVYFVLEPSTVREITKGESSKHATFSVQSKAFTKLVSDWDNMVDGPQHEAWRKMMMVALSPSAIERYLPALQKTVERGLQEWAEQGCVALLPASRDLALDFAVDVLAGVKLKYTDRLWLRQQLVQMFKGLYSLYLPLPGTTYSKAQAARVRVMAALVKELEQQVREICEADSGAGEFAAVSELLQHQGDGLGMSELLRNMPEMQVNYGRVADGMERLKSASVTVTSDCGVKSASGFRATQADAQIEFLRAQRRLTAESAAARVIGAYLAAGDATRQIVFGTIAILALVPEEIKKIREEQQRVFAQHGDQLTPAVLSEMAYLDAVIKECSRLLPPSRGSLKQALKPLMLNGVHVPAGAYMMYSTDCMHCLEPTLWRGPESIPPGAEVPPYMDWRNNLRAAFQPSRWLPGGEKPKQYITFGAGNHLCLGMNVVYMEIKMMLSVMARDYEWHMEDPSVLKNMTVFPLFKTAPGADLMRITCRKVS